MSSSLRKRLSKLMLANGSDSSLFFAHSGELQTLESPVLWRNGEDQEEEQQHEDKGKEKTHRKRSASISKLFKSSGKSSTKISKENHDENCEENGDGDQSTSDKDGTKKKSKKSSVSKAWSSFKVTGFQRKESPQDFQSATSKKKLPVMRKGQSSSEIPRRRGPKPEFLNGSTSKVENDDTDEDKIVNKTGIRIQIQPDSGDLKINQTRNDKNLNGNGNEYENENENENENGSSGIKSLDEVNSARLNPKARRTNLKIDTTGKTHRRSKSDSVATSSSWNTFVLADDHEVELPQTLFSVCEEDHNRKIQTSPTTEPINKEDKSKENSPTSSEWKGKKSIHSETSRLLQPKEYEPADYLIDENGKRIILSGTPEALIDVFVRFEQLDSLYVYNFLATHRYFMTSENLLSSLLSRYRGQGIKKSITGDDLNHTENLPEILTPSSSISYTSSSLVGNQSSGNIFPQDTQDQIPYPSPHFSFINSPPYQVLSVPSTISWKAFYELQILAILRVWLVRFTCDFEENDGKLKTRLKEFLLSIQDPNDENINYINLFIDLLDEIVEARKRKDLFGKYHFGSKDSNSSPRNSVMFSTPLSSTSSNNLPPNPEEAPEFNLAIELNSLPLPPPTSLAVFSTTPTLLSFKPKEVARQLTLLEMELFRNIKHWEFMNQKWNKKKTQHETPGLLQMIHWFDNICNWTATEICACGNIKERVAILKHLISVGEHLLHYRNFNGVFEIVSGLGLTPVYRLTKTWKLLPTKTRVIWKELHDLISSTENFNNYRQKLSERKTPTIPFIGVFLTDLTFTESALSSSTKDDKINFQKFSKIGDILNTMYLCQLKDYPFEEGSSFLNWLSHVNILKGEELFNLSLKWEDTVKEV